MARSLPPTLARLLAANDPAAFEAAWAPFLAEYTPLLLHVARKFRKDYDAAADAYACIVEQLRADDSRRLRTFVADGRSDFSTWLVVVAQRICLDHLRHRYGRRRSQPDHSSADTEAAARRRLVDLVGAEVDLSSLVDNFAVDPEEAARTGEAYAALRVLLLRLEPRDRLLLKLRFEDDLPVTQVAENLGYPTRFHVYRRLAIVLGQLRAELEKRGISDPAP
jgi:RNA polymerase sigma factor (sigma-70 family)